MKTTTAVYENGVLRLCVPGDLAGLTEGQVVAVTIRTLDEDEFERDLEAQGLLEKTEAPSESPPGDYRPPVLDGEPLSETVLRLRGDRP
jgi:predicted DNA-binding antitoxin AbrB/MazE fold protein